MADVPHGETIVPGAGHVPEPRPETGTEAGPIEVARAESERGELVLRRRGDAVHPVWELRANGVFVMDTLETTSERALATAALALCPHPAQVLVGGLGLGFTLAEVLADPRVERCTVVEIEDALVGWMRDGTVPHGPALLAHDRVRIVVADVAVALLEAPPCSYGLVLLDVDNGPGYLVHDANAALYGRAFLERIAPVLRPGGVLAIWSAATSPELADVVRAVFGEVEELGYDVALQGREERYWLYVARVASEA
ncbi:spermidine synthase [Nocardioides fonticola]|uniref:Spermidine synthase n=1 Tax=Nocardioides fonticola TaxID=450363 RepID=A0ABP7XHN6_9ACTN